MEIPLLICRFGAGAALCVFSVAKLAVFPSAASLMWRPGWLSNRLFILLTGFVALNELTLGIIIAFGLLDPGFILIYCTIMLLAVSTYGTFSLRQSGNCGCGPPQRKHRLTIPVLWLRNIVLFLGGGLASFGSSTLWKPAETATNSISILGILPMIIIFSALAGRFALGNLSFRMHKSQSDSTFNISEANL